MSPKYIFAFLTFTLFAYGYTKWVDTMADQKRIDIVGCMNAKHGLTKADYISCAKQLRLRA